MSTPVRANASVPWRLGDLLVVYATTVTGVALVLAAWYAASGEVTLAAQTGWLTLGTAGVIVLGAGNLAWFLAGRRAVTVRRRELCAVGFDARPRPAVDEAQRHAPARPEALVAARTMTRFHRPDCLLVAGKPVRAYTLATHRARGRRPCDVCNPSAEVPGAC